MYQITFQFENGAKPVIVDAAPNTTLLDIAKAANVAIDAPCNGNGSCGKCRVKLLKGSVDSVPTHHISEEEYAEGWRLSCASKPTSDVVVQVPDIASAYQSRTEASVRRQFLRKCTRFCTVSTALSTSCSALRFPDTISCASRPSFARFLAGRPVK